MSADRGYSFDCQLMLAMNGHLHSEKEKENEVRTCAHACNHMRNTHTHAPGNTLNRCERRPQAHNGLNTVGVRLGVGPGL